MTADQLRELFAKHIQIARGRKSDAAAEADPSRLLIAPAETKRRNA